MTNAEITASLRNCLAELLVVNQSPDFSKIEHSRFYATTNDVFLGDAINTISEVICAIEEAEKYEAKANAIASHIMAQLGK
jgi:hypothetical protein